MEKQTKTIWDQGTKQKRYPVKSGIQNPLSNNTVLAEINQDLEGDALHL